MQGAVPFRKATPRAFTNKRSCGSVRVDIGWNGRCFDPLALKQVPARGNNVQDNQWLDMFQKKAGAQLRVLLEKDLNKMPAMLLDKLDELRKKELQCVDGRVE
jgi:hypothetical protein